MTSKHPTQELLRTIAHRVKEFRKAAGLTQEQLSEKVDIAPQYLSRLETARRVPSLDTIVDLANALNTTPSVLLAEPQQDAQAERMSRLEAILTALTEEDAAFVESQLAGLISHLKHIRRDH
jgi:transcriptional regulator with XRE-family HTH domain